MSLTSLQDPAEQAPQRAADARRSPRAMTLGGAGRIFAAGIIAGYALAVLVGATSARLTSRLTAADVVPMKGEDVEARPERTSLAPALIEAHASREQPAVVSDTVAAVSSREVARAAVAVTAWVSGTGVYGAGIVIDDHHVLTCLHVVEGMRAIQLSVAGGPLEPAEVVDRDSALDLAVLRTGSVHPVHARLSSAASMEMGDAAYAMGAPRKMTFSLSAGIISYAGRPYSGVYYLQTDIPTNAGSSGGPVLDAQGRVVGISSFILRDSQGLAFALPVDYAVRRFETRFADRLDSSRFDAWLAERSRQGSEAPATRPEPAR